MMVFAISRLLRVHDTAVQSCQTSLASSSSLPKQASRPLCRTCTHGFENSNGICDERGDGVLLASACHFLSTARERRCACTYSRVVL